MLHLVIRFRDGTILDNVAFSSVEDLSCNFSGFGCFVVANCCYAVSEQPRFLRPAGALLAICCADVVGCVSNRFLATNVREKCEVMRRRSRVVLPFHAHPRTGVEKGGSRRLEEEQVRFEASAGTLVFCEQDLGRVSCLACKGKLPFSVTSSDGV